ncbi:MAG TPA: hypothetical protein VK209_01045 [Candidatus Sulfotelmatobacter sp.]|nr:hypothetical protein [Candidatus Sulfotelmatobacter sp.]
MSGKQSNIKDRLQKISDTVSDYKETLTEAFKDMDVKVKDWNFAVTKTEERYDVEMTFKLHVKPKLALE